MDTIDYIPTSREYCTIYLVLSTIPWFEAHFCWLTTELRSFRSSGAAGGGRADERAVGYLQVQLGSAASPKVPFTQLDPTKGQVTRMWNDYLGSTGKPLGLRGSAQTLSQYCGFDNANGPSGARAGN